MSWRQPTPTAGKLTGAIVAALGDPVRHHQLRGGAWRMASDLSGQDHVALLETVLRQSAGG